MAFIDRLSGFCGGSRMLAWLLTINAATALTLWLAGAVTVFCGHDSSVLYSLTALPSDPLSFATHPWTLATYMVAHFSPLHMLVNMLWLFWFGRMLADSGREIQLLWLYIGSGICGGIFYIAASVISSHAPGTYLTGASAAVLGVVGATAMLMPSRRVNLFLFGEVKLKWVATGCIALTLLGSWGAGVPPQIAHLGGLAFGLVATMARKITADGGPQPCRHNSTRARTLNARKTMKAMKRLPDDHERLDQLLDKIRVSGYDSLTARERTELNHISSRIEQ